VRLLQRTTLDKIGVQEVKDMPILFRLLG
jgi:hypothetical protein